MNLSTLEQYKQATWLEHALNSPEEADHLFSFYELINLDEQSKFPKKQADILTLLGLNHYYVPVELGGSLQSFEAFVSIFKSLYRRDLSLGLGYGSTTFLAAVHIYLAGHPLLKKRAAELVLSGQTLSVCYHEKEHGNDLLSNTTKAMCNEDGSYNLHGTKWVINNVQTSKGLTVFAQTSTKAGGRGFSLFFIDKELIDTGTLSYHPKIKTHGVRACNIAGITMNHTRLSSTAVIGNIGDGAELTFKGFQITRATLPGMSLGACDTALRTVMKFATKRHLYGKSIMQLPHVYETLTEAYISLLLCDALSITATRSLHFIPEQMSIIAAITKFYIPKTMQGMLKTLSVILGARHYVREGEYAIFQKILRDYPVVSIGHSSDVICANTILPQMKQLLTKPVTSENLTEIISALFTLEQAVKPFEAKRLRMSNSGYNDIIKSIDLIEPLLEQKISFGEKHTAIKESVMTAVAFIKNKHLELTNQLKLMEENKKGFSKQTYQFIESYCRLFVGMSCVWLWIFNQKKISRFFDDGFWLVLSLKKLFPHIISLTQEVYTELTLEALNDLEKSYHQKLSFSIIPIHYL